MRGEDFRLAQVYGNEAGSPPHARGRLYNKGRVEMFARITPACAGKTPIRCSSGRATQDHPRMRGEDGSPTPS